MTIRVSIPLKTTNPLNNSQGFSKFATYKKAAERKEQRLVTALAVRAALQANWPGLPIVITLTRAAPSSGLDEDNLGATLKSVRDGVTDALGFANDRDPLLTFLYDQRRSARGVYGVDVVIVPRTCRPFAPGCDSCLAHEGHYIGANGLCIEGRRRSA